MSLVVWGGFLGVSFWINVVFSLVIHSGTCASCRHLSISSASLSWMEVNFLNYLTLRIQPWPIRLVPPGNFRRHSIPRLCLPIQDNCYHSPRCVFWYEWQCFSYLRPFPILAGIHTEIKSLLGEGSYLSRFTKVHKKKENNDFKFLKAIVFI